MTRRIACVVLAGLLAPAAGAGQSSTSLLVSVASSLGDVVSDLARRYEARTGQAVRLNVAGSNFLAQQIAQGARVDVFVSADQAQMDVVERAGRLVAGSRVDLVTNQLVVVGPPGSTARVTGPRDLAAPEVSRVALGNPNSVPAGVYARRWLEGAGVWTAVAPRVVPTLTVRAALAAVRSGRTDLAVVYFTDAKTDPSVPVLYAVPIAEAPPIRYPAALVAGRNQRDAAGFLAFLRSAEAGDVFTAAGFGLPR